MGETSLSDVYNVQSQDSSCTVPRIAIIGDSLAAGAASSSQGYGNYLQDALSRSGQASYIQNVSVAGATSDYGPEAAQRLIDSPNKPNVVVLELGGNDMLQGRAPSVIRENLQTTIDILKENNVSVVLVGLETQGVDSLARFSNYNGLYRNLAEANDLILDPQVYGSILRTDFGRSSSEEQLARGGLLASDGVHFTPTGARLTAEGLVPEVTEAIRQLEQSANPPIFCGP